jgi:hypothetical protein
MIVLPLHAIPVLIDGEVRLRVHAGRDLKVDMPLRPRQALALAALLLNHALMAGESASTHRGVLETAGEQDVALGKHTHG